MARKRDRRVAADSSGRRNRDGTSNRQNQSKESKLTIVFFVVFLVSASISMLVYRIKYAPRKNSLLDVHQRGLVKANMNYREILAENENVLGNMSHRHYTYPVLAYITPWNSKGYDLAKRFNSKFTHLSPIWYTLNSQGTKLILEGRHNADMGWISDLRKKGGAQVVPRVVLEAFHKDLLRKKKLRDKAINLIVTECKEMDYDGIVLESWSRWAAYGFLHDPVMRNMAVLFIKQLGQALHSANSGTNNKQLQLIYVIGPPHSERLQEHDFGPQDLQILSDAVDGFSLMTYDFSGPHHPGPNAPLKWVRSVLQMLLGSTREGAHPLAHKIFLGINFYGNDFPLSEGSGGGAITGRDYLSLLEKHQPELQWENNSGEHFFLYFDHNQIKHAVFYPTLLSISMRLEEAHLWGTGISIWEIGQAFGGPCWV
ncbi:uncharacterized protein LOC131166225 isoform X2 [Malania oleifera]|uniref:uncharacterized protein LOC131166225 isoform X2 n=1 Tax=Malania oleifera TaxID=397392 RepID=UPI0025AE29A1|nr:uncharacterized protein LOC131166225 isoform X2 [Malania oleifera]